MSLFSSQDRLLKRLHRQDRRAFEEVVAANYISISRQLWHLTGDQSTAEDLTQETFVQAWQSLSNFDGRASVATWLHAIAMRVWYRRLHQERHRVTQTSLADALLHALASDNSDPEYLSDRSAAYDTLAHAVNDLPPVYRRAIWLFYRDELKYRDIAEQEQVPIGTVKSRLSTALRLLRAHFSSRQEELL